ncbi:MAG: hypothetical protein MZV49_06810 [Rhodopseudomonas palustris]|nr:hypothetical protein [Rhodopseudomonas palustris]
MGAGRARAGLQQGQELFALINGGAELFLRHGFERAAVQSYPLAPARHIQAEIYMMQSMDGAATVFARKSGQESRRWLLATAAPRASTTSSSIAGGSSSPSLPAMLLRTWRRRCFALPAPSRIGSLRRFPDYCVW